MHARTVHPVASLLVVALASAVPPQGAPPPAAGRLVPARSDFVEVPGVRELTSRLIVRPWPRRALREAGLGREAAEARVAAARRELSRHEVLEHVPATNDSILRVPAGVSEAELADALLSTGLFQYAEPDWLLAPLGVQQDAAASAGTTRPAAGPSTPATPTPGAGAAPGLPLPRRVPPRTAASDQPRCPDDPLFPAQWHHQAGVLESCAAWGLPPGTVGGPQVSIAFCDTGLRATHEDLAQNQLEGYNAVDMLWASEGGLVTPVSTHGTRTTGTAAASGNNGVGVSGVGWNLSHRMVRVSNISSGNAYLSDLQHGARTAVENGDRVANVSYHGAASASNAGTASYVKALGGLLVWGAGNTSSNYSSSDRDDDDLIVVGATDQGDALAYFSSYGTFVDLVAPGVGIVTTSSASDSSYATVEGTSYAAPIASGACALLWCARPTLSPSDVERILKLSADDLGAPGLDPTFGYGRVDLESMLGSTWSAPPAADFAIAAPTGVSPLPIAFTDLSTGVPTAWAWDFGDGGTSTLQNPVHTYTSSGAYTVSLTVTNALGADATVQVDTVLVDVIPPVADFSATVTGGLAPLTVDFTDLSTGGVPTSWSWDFGDGGGSTAQNPTHTYTASGFYTVSLTVSNAYGTDTRTRTSYVAVDFIPPVADFGGTPTSGASPYVVSFTDLSGGGVATSWSWTFGDGGASTAQHPTHTYTAEGLYTVRLTASNAYGSDTRIRTGYVEVLPGPSILADFTATPTTGAAPLEVAFTDLSIGNIVSWEWNFGDGTTSTLQNPTHVYTTPDQYDVALQVTNADGKDSCLELQALVTVN